MNPRPAEPLQEVAACGLVGEPGLELMPVAGIVYSADRPLLLASRPPLQHLVALERSGFPLCWMSCLKVYGRRALLSFRCGRADRRDAIGRKPLRLLARSAGGPR